MFSISKWLGAQLGAPAPQPVAPLPALAHVPAGSRDWAKILYIIEPHARPVIIAGFAAALDKVVAYADLSTPLRIAHFLAQCSEESAGLRTTVEYGAGREYEGRADLGNTHPGDGPRYKGRGVLQLTGRVNYAAYGRELGLDLVDHPELAASFPGAAMVAAHFWKDRGLNKFADADDIKSITHRVNGGENGLTMRRLYLGRAKLALGPGA